MERSISVVQRRTAAFNPEAAAFSPLFSSPILQEVDSVRPTSPTLPQSPRSFLPMAPMFNCSRFQAVGDARSFYRSEAFTPAPVRLEDFLSPEVQSLVKRLEEHPDIQEITTQTPTQGTAQVIQSTPTEFPSFKFPPQTPQPDYNAVDVSELSAGLGLPAMKPDPNIGASPATSHKSRITHSHPGALYGKLIGWALDKPLTAKDLAEYLQTQDSHTAAEMLVLAPTAPTASTIRLNVTTNQSPSKTRSADNDSDTFSVTPVSTETKAVPKGPSQHQHRRGSGHSSVSFRQHNRNPSYRRYPRRASRAKRSDQGPMPSAADIYPDDANWTVPRPIYEGDDYTTYKSPAVEQPQVIVDNAFNWPTPAQVYKPEPAPTAADVAAADDDVLTLMSELPEPSLNTLVSLGTSRDLNIFTGLDLPCESRALTPAQLDGSRYGMRFYSIAYGDQWELPKVNESEPFRVRPRDHDGWGGWEWALRKGCGV